MSDDIPIRPRAGCAFFAMPVVLAAVLVTGYGTLLWSGAVGRPADGARVTLAFDGCPEATDAVTARVTSMGLGEPIVVGRADGFDVTATLPADPDIAARIPTMLARPGLLAVVADDGTVVVDASHVETATLRLDLTGEPAVAVQLDPAGVALLASHTEGRPDGHVDVQVDGVSYGTRENTPPERRGHLNLRIGEPTRQAQVAAAADLGIVLAAPLPCTPTARP